MRRTYSALYLGIWLYTTVAQTVGLRNRGLKYGAAMQL